MAHASLESGADLTSERRRIAKKRGFTFKSADFSRAKKFQIPVTG